MNLLFICSRNKLRSPTAERIFCDRDGIDAIGAGLNPDSPTPLTGDLIEWADLVLVMEEGHRERLKRRFSEFLGGKRVVVLGIPDNFQYMADDLVELLESRVAKYL